ncbi:hypothetical protein BT69DRAFT_1261034 [Atractiella rhizophila]|nr:hypothetical protein BT69DRAFT_1261034 [Atractiella rhizophila]
MASLRPLLTENGSPASVSAPLPSPRTPSRSASTGIFRRLIRSPSFDTPILSRPRRLLHELEGWDNEVSSRFGAAYQDGATIDWAYEDSKSRIRTQKLRTVPGIHGAAIRTLELLKPWIVVILTGLLTGTLAAALDVLSIWLADLREGYCEDDLYLNRSTCCSGLDPGETCDVWRLHFKHAEWLFGNFARYLVYIASGTVFATIAAVFVRDFAPYATHTGIPEIKTILSGYVIKGFLSGATLLVKFIGLTLAVASGLSLGEEGPLVHVASAVGNVISRFFGVFRENEAKRREIISASAAAGLTTAFGSPLGGVLFALEEVSYYFPASTLWQSFVCSVIAAVTLQWIDPFKTGKLALFVVSSSQTFAVWESASWVLIGVAGGVFGYWFTRLNMEFANFRKRSGVENYPVLEATTIAFFTALLSYLLEYMRLPTSELVALLFTDCDSDSSSSLCNSTGTFSTLLSLVVTATAKTFLTAVTFGAAIPAGIFLPSLAIGASFGRAVSIFLGLVQNRHPDLWLFAGCGITAGEACVKPSIYAIVGSVAFLSGVTKMTVSLVVIFFELTGNIDVLIPVMLAVIFAKFSGDLLSKEGIYEAWINFRQYPFLSNKLDYRKDKVLAKDVMTPINRIVMLEDVGCPLDRLKELLQSEYFRGFPIITSKTDPVLLGYVSRDELRYCIEQAEASGEVNGDTLCYFTSVGSRTARGRAIVIGNDKQEPSAAKHDHEHDYYDTTVRVEEGRGQRSEDSSQTDNVVWLNIKPWIDQTPLHVNQSMPMEIVIQLFQRMGLRVLLLTSQGRLSGMLTKKDVWRHQRET